MISALPSCQRARRLAWDPETSAQGLRRVPGDGCMGCVNEGGVFGVEGRREGGRGGGREKRLGVGETGARCP
jgi:hypothetical protein